MKVSLRDGRLTGKTCPSVRDFHSLLWLHALLAIVFLLTSATASLALTAEQIAVIANKNQPDSLRLATFYMEKRGIPVNNLITIDIDPAESCKRSDYNTFIAKPIRSFLEKYSSAARIRCLVSMYGVPLKITTPSFSLSARQTFTTLKQKKEDLQQSVEKSKGDVQESLKKELVKIKKELSYYRKINDMRASVDSELSLLLRIYPLAHWLPNPFYKGNPANLLTIGTEDILMVSRLDGPDPESVKRIITDSLAAEQNGLQGTAFLDARWPDPGIEAVRNYRWYDRSIHRAAGVIEKSDTLQSVVIDDSGELFQPGPRRKAALYCGWYSLAHYIDAFDWQTGAVGYHIASSECTTLKKKGSQVWCKIMLEKGVAATIGPVGEPYVHAFPPPDLFFSFLTSGKTLIESYFFSLPHLSWKMVLIGDPLYRPFK